MRAVTLPAVMASIPAAAKWNLDVETARVKLIDGLQPLARL